MQTNAVVNRRRASIPRFITPLTTSSIPVEPEQVGEFISEKDYASSNQLTSEGLDLVGWPYRMNLHIRFADHL